MNALVLMAMTRLFRGWQLTAFLRGILSISAACSGVLLTYGLIYAMEGMTSRLPTLAVKELLIATVFMLPWTLLFCSGFHDLAEGTNRHWLFWGWTVLLLAFLYYLDRNTTEAELTKVGMPLLACLGAVVPHAFRRVAVIYSVVSVLFAICGIAMLYFVGQTLFTPGRSFTTPAIAGFMLFFPLTAIAAGVLAISTRFHRSRPM